jgi:putative glutathione S-transferase
MGLLVEGKWRTDWYDTKSTGGAFVRKESSFRNWVTADGSAGPSGIAGFQAEAGRYHLYVSLACPWAHRALILRKLKGLEEMIGISVVNAYMGPDGWTFQPGPGVVPDTVNGAQRLSDIYTLAAPYYTGRVTVPVLWDKKLRTIVNNESSEIIRMFNSAFDSIGALPGDYYPEDLREEIDAVNAVIYPKLNNGVYRAGFATSRHAYENAVQDVFATLDMLEQRLGRQRYLVGDRLTEADWRLFTTLVRFDSVYVAHFKCSIRRIVDYPNIWAYLRELYQYPGIAETVDIEHTKQHYFGSHGSLNPTGIVPVGPVLDWQAVHGREGLADFR